MSEGEKIKFDGQTGKWVIAHQGVETTVAKCEACGLYYKPSLGHACKKKKKGDNLNDRIPKESKIQWRPHRYHYPELYL